jgi:hypothetical protein
MIIAVDGAVRIARCYSYATQDVAVVGVIIVGLISDTGIIRITPPLSFTTPETRELEVELMREYANRADICIFDGVPTHICKQNIGVIKSGEAADRGIKGWICAKYGAYMLCSDANLDRKLATKAVELNSKIHEIVNRHAAAWFRWELTRRKCVLPKGIHVIPELSYFSPSK